MLLIDRYPEEDSAIRSVRVASSLRPNRILSKLGGRVRQHVVDIEVLPERRAVDHPDEVLVKCLPRLPFGIRHARMLDFNVYAGRRFDVCAMDFSVRRDVRDFPTVNGETVLPFPMPLRLILPPRIAVAAAAMCSMMDNSRAAFGDHSGVAGRTVPSSTRKVLLSFTIHQPYCMAAPASATLSKSSASVARFRVYFNWLTLFVRVSPF